MAQQTNLNVSPYFDDFDADNDYYRVLFKPGFPVQARELTTLQSILQNQIEKFGQHFFKEGSKVIPGNTNYNPLYYAVELQNIFSGIPVSAYADRLIGTTIRGETSGVSAVVNQILLPNESERGNLTLYVSYLSASTENNNTIQFSDGENLITTTTISSGLLGNPNIDAGSPFATTLQNNSTSTGSSFSIGEGIYFIRGQFVNVNSETLILDQYTNRPNYRVGLFVSEQIITETEDQSLQDNSQGYNNYSSPGADRLRIRVSLFKKSLDDLNDNNFIELATIVDGTIKTQKANTTYNTFRDELARRTYAESGDYYVNPFTLSVEESLNDGIGNRGLFNPGQFTYNGSTPSADQIVYQISPGKAFVRGYEIDTISPTFLDAAKPRTVRSVENQSINYNTGPTFIVNGSNGSPTIGFGNTYFVSLRDERVGLTRTTASGREIGVARVYDFKLSSGVYNTSNRDLNQWELSLYDVQTTTDITVNEPVTLDTPTFVKGLNSGATGFLKDSVASSTLITLYETNGNFIPNESLVIEETATINRTAIAVTSYGLSDVKSIYGVQSGVSTFSADVVQSTSLDVGIATVGAVRYFRNVPFLNTDLTSTVGIGSTQIFVSDTTGVSVGSSISVGTALTNASVHTVASNYVYIGTASTLGPISSNTGITTSVGFGSTTLYVDSIPNGLLAGVSRISVGTGLTDITVVAIGDTFVQIGAGDTTTGGTAYPLVTSITSNVNAGSTEIFVGITTGVVSGSSLVSVGSALTSVTVTGIGSTSIFIGTGSTSASLISAGTAVTFTNVSNLITGSGVTFSNVSQLESGDIATFSDMQFTSRVSSPNILFPGTSVRENNIISYASTSSLDPFFGRVVSVGTTHVEIVGVTTVSGICDGELPSGTISITDLKVLTSRLDASTDNTLYTVLPRQNISEVDLNNSTLTIRKSFTVDIQNGELSIPLSSGLNETFLPYTDARYTLTRSNGVVEDLSNNRFVFLNGGTQLQIYGLGSNDTGARLTTTLRKIRPTNKVKIKNRVNTLIVDKSKYEGSGIGATTLDNGLEFGTYPYGTRVEDERICLNVPDVLEIHGVFESLDSNDASCPTAVLSSLNGETSTTSDLVIGERFTGQTSGAVAIVAERVTSSQIGFIYKNQSRFSEGERILFAESNVQGTLTTLDSPSSDISSNYTFVNGQKSTYYDYGYLDRTITSAEPTRQIKVYYSNGFYNTSDLGDVTTANSYSGLDYTRDIRYINDNRTTDVIDIRPFVSEYSVSLNATRSPFEFYARLFDQTGNSASNVLASNESILLSFSFYLGRIDRVFLSKDGTFQIKYGIPAENPQVPDGIDESLEVAVINLPPYLHNVSDASIRFLDYKRYRMSDIRQLEDRIKNLEYYTALSLLETNTSALFIPDSSGLNRFKSGFFVDNFTTVRTQENSIEFKNSIDRSNQEIRPAHYTTSIDLITGPVSNISPDEDLSDPTLIQNDSINIAKTGDIITLAYSATSWLSQQFATRIEPVNPVISNFWRGSLDLTPSSDTWVDPVRLSIRVIDSESNYSDILTNSTIIINTDPQSGYIPSIWNSWEDTWVGRSIAGNRANRVINGLSRSTISVSRPTITYEQLLNNTRTLSGSISNPQTASSRIDGVSIGNRYINREVVPYMRSRNVQFVGKGIRPNTQLYAFFDGRDITRYCVPKLLEISMISGAFEVGETVYGTISSTDLNSPSQLTDIPNITFRVAQSNHREGNYNESSVVYTQNPYVSGQTMPAAYSSTSTILNVDIFSLANQAQSSYGGWIAPGMVLVGQTSQARATITNVRLITDVSSTLIGSLYIPNPNNIDHPRFETGSKLLTLIDNQQNDRNSSNTIAEETFSSSGYIETIQDDIISVRMPSVQNRVIFDNRPISRLIDSIIANSTQNNRGQVSTPVTSDPLSQTFIVEDPTGVFVTSCNIFFSSVDQNNVPIQIQIRTVENGVPTTKILPFSNVFLNPNQIQTSSNGSVATNFTFKSPVYLEGGKEYAICLLTNSTAYNVFVARGGGVDLERNNTISSQPYLGTLFKPQNVSNRATWEQSLSEDLKFTLFRANFESVGSVNFYNPELTTKNAQIANLPPNSLTLNSRRIRVSLSSTIFDSGITFGNTVSILGGDASGNYVGNAGIATGSLNIINAGIGYTPSAGVATYYGVPLINVSGNGSGATADVTIQSGAVGFATISSSGSGYRVGDVLELGEIVNIPTGANTRLSVSSIGEINQIILDNVQGSFPVGVGSTVIYINGSGITTSLNGGGISISRIETESDGLHIKVDHRNHGMYFADNLVKISKVSPDTRPTRLTQAFNTDNTSSISVESTVGFGTFENVGVSTSNPGFLIIGEEIISYTSASAGLISGIISRELGNTISRNYAVGTPVYKYELSGISLHRINKTHNLEDVTISDPITFDSYNVRIDTSLTTDGMIDRSVNNTTLPTLYIRETKTAGGYSAKASQNIPYELIRPSLQNLTVSGTSISASVRTITSSSINGNEIPYIDNGLESISINENNYLDSPRMICSKVNEDDRLTSLPGNKSFNMQVILNSSDNRLSPVIDTQRASVILTSNRINSPITNYSLDNRVNSLISDPHAFQYVSKEINLENSASSIRIILDAHINTYSDIRAFYAIGENQDFTPIFVPFPGFNNLNIRNEIINPENNDGLSDIRVVPSNITGFESSDIDFREYVFTANNLANFRNYRIKIVLTSTSQVYVPRVRNLRVIALA